MQGMGHNIQEHHRRIALVLAGEMPEELGDAVCVLLALTELLAWRKYGLSDEVARAAEDLVERLPMARGA